MMKIPGQAHPVRSNPVSYFYIMENIKIQEDQVMKKYECEVCGYIYDEEKGDPDNGIAPGTKWEDIPEDWVCPLCSVGKDQFKEA